MMPRTVTIVRCYCETCGHVVLAMSIGALIDAKRDHEAYVRWQTTVAVPPSLP